MFHTLPPSAIALGLGGLLPFLAFGAGAVGPWAPQFCLMALIGYGAVILSFLGGVHWGFALPEGQPDRPRRLGLGVLPSLIGWSALLLATVAPGAAALGLLALGFAATLAVETRLAAADHMPDGYMGLRWLLSLVVLTVLVGVALLLLFGGRIVF